MNRWSRLFWTGQALGWENLPRRLWYVARHRLGIDRHRLPGGELPVAAMATGFSRGYCRDDAPSHWLRRAERCFVSPDRRCELRSPLVELVDERLWAERVASQVDALPRGYVRFFNHRMVDVGWPVRFNRDPLHQLDWPIGSHWSSYGQFDPRLNDLKCVWEASRFSVAYALARDHVRQPSSLAAELFWQMFDDWDRQNPYGSTPQWACSQEASFRAFAWLFAACAMLDSSAATSQRLHRMTELIWYTGRHVSANINYARSQKNNHAISEAVALWTIGHLFPELRAAERWREQGRNVLIAEMRRQVYADGSYVQHSLNYHRVMLDDCLWAICLGRRVGEPLEEIAEPFSRAVHWLLEMIDPRTGRVPNYGPNDGAQVLPLSCCDYLDFRPVAQAAHYVLYGRRCFEPGLWDEKLFWLCGAEPLRSPVQARPRTSHFSARDGGYYTLAGPRSWALVRAHSYRDRPHQADMLHVDLWFDGENILRDGGSYHYYCEAPWYHFFESTAAHNTVEVDGEDQMIHGPRFLWLRWTKSKLLRFEVSSDGTTSVFEAEHYGYRRLSGRVVHRRRIVRTGDQYRVSDDLAGAGTHDVALRWRLCPGAWRQDGTTWTLSDRGRRVTITLGHSSDIQSQLLIGQVEPKPTGWESLYYADKQVTPVLVARGRVTLPVRLETMIALA